MAAPNVRQAVPVIANDIAPEVTAEQITTGLQELLARRDAITAIARSIGGESSFEPIAYLPHTQQVAFVVCAWATLMPGLQVIKYDDGEIRVLASTGAVVCVRAPVATARAVQEALRAPHWTEDKTTSLDAASAEVVTTAVRP